MLVNFLSISFMFGILFSYSNVSMGKRLMGSLFRQSVSYYTIHSFIISKRSIFLALESLSSLGVLTLLHWTFLAIFKGNLIYREVPKHRPFTGETCFKMAGFLTYLCLAK